MLLELSFLLQEYMYYLAHELSSSYWKEEGPLIYFISGVGVKYVKNL